MSRSVSAPSSVTKTSPCWNGLIVPGSTFRYGSNFWSWTRRPRALSSRPSDAATMPFPSADTTPPVTNTYFGARALTGFQGSSDGGRRSDFFARAQQVVQPVEREARQGAAQAEEPRRVHDEERVGAALVLCVDGQVGLDAVRGELERESSHRHDVQHDERAGRLRAPEVAGLRRADDLPPRAGCEAAPVGLDSSDARPPVREVVRLREEGPDVVERREQHAGRRVARHQRTLARNSWPPSIRSSSPFRSSSPSSVMRVCVGSPGTFSTRNWRSASAAICGRWVIVTTCARSARRFSDLPTAFAVSPPMPASISSKIRVSPPATAAIASAIRDSSPPEAVSATGAKGSPAFGRTRKSASSPPVAPASRSRSSQTN